MEKLKLNSPIMDEFGQIVIKDMTIGQSLASRLMKSVSNDETKILKFYNWAKVLGKDNPLELDEVDAELLKQFVINDQELFNIVKAPVVRAINSLKFK